MKSIREEVISEVQYKYCFDIDTKPQDINPDTEESKEIVWDDDTQKWFKNMIIGTIDLAIQKTLEEVEKKMPIIEISGRGHFSEVGFFKGIKDDRFVFEPHPDETEEHEWNVGWCVIEFKRFLSELQKLKGGEQGA